MTTVNRNGVYEQIGLNYRFFLGWRHAAFGGYLLAMAAIISKAIDLQADGNDSWKITLLVATPLGGVFWLIDYRIRQLFRCAIQAGRGLEEAAKIRGFFSEQDAVGTIPSVDAPYPKILSHSTTITTVYFLCGLACIAFVVLR